MTDSGNRAALSLLLLCMSVCVLFGSPMRHTDIIRQHTPQSFYIALNPEDWLILLLIISRCFSISILCIMFWKSSQILSKYMAMAVFFEKFDYTLMTTVIILFNQVSLSVPSYYLFMRVSASTVFAVKGIHAWRCTWVLVYECVSVCAVYTKQFISSALHIFWWARFTHASAWLRSAGVIRPLVCLPEVNRIPWYAP